MKELYNKQKQACITQAIAINDIIVLHVEFAYFNPFHDGNGRIGRRSVLKEYLRHHIIPFLINDTRKFFYYHGFSTWNTEKG